VNDLIWRSLSKAGFPSIKELQDLLLADGKRPDGLTLTPWKEGRCATWDVTVTDTVAASYLSATSACSGSAAEAAASRKEDKYAEISSNTIFSACFPLAFETYVPTNQVGSDFFVRWVNYSPSFLMTLVKLLFFFSTSFCFYSAL